SRTASRTCSKAASSGSTSRDTTIGCRLRSKTRATGTRRRPPGAAWGSRTSASGSGPHSAPEPESMHAPMRAPFASKWPCPASPMTDPVHPRLRVAIVDDEPLARAVLREFLSAAADVEIVAECANGFEAVKVVAELRPDLLFLDVQMPKLDGF